MPKEHEQPNITGIESEVLNPVFIAQLASRLFNETEVPAVAEQKIPIKRYYKIIYA